MATPPPNYEELPLGFTRCDYLESTGALGFDTGVSIKEKIIYIDSLWTKLSEYPTCGVQKIALFGENYENECLIGWQTDLRYSYLGGRFEYQLYLNKRYNMIISTISHNLYLKVDGTTVRSAKGITTSSNMHLFEGTGSEVHAGSSRLYHTYQKLYKCTIKDANDNYVRYFIPALDIVKRPCMYDTVTLTAFYNEGEGEFLYKLPTEFKKRPYPSNKLFPLGGKGNIELPHGYVRCEYLQSTGTLGFDTGVSIKDKIIRIDSLWTALSINPNKEYSTYNALFGENAKTNECVIGWHSLNKHYFGGTWNYSLSLNTRYYIKIITLTGNLGITINENILRQGINSYIVNLNLRLFTGTGAYDYDAPYYTYQKLYKCTIADANGILIRNFIPALDETGIPCMYDTVSKQPFYNEGTGEFLYKIK